MMQNCISQTIVSGNKAGIEKMSQNNSYGFVENKGQVHDQNNKPINTVKYLLSTNGLNVQLKANSFSYDTYLAIGVNDLHENTNTKSNGDAPLSPYLKNRKEKELSFEFHRIDVSLEGANAAPVIIPENPSKSVLNYYTSATQPSGIEVVHHYSKITYSNIYPGIDLVFEESQQKPGKKLEYYFIVKPGMLQ
jgi:hypothetical protein